MSARGELWLIRHGETEWSASGRHTGRTDVPLTSVGQARATRLAPLLGGRKFAAVWCSPLQRARETARLAGFPDVRLDDDLLEWDYGVYEGRTTAEIRSAQKEWSVWTSPMDGGESLEQLGIRAKRVAERAAGLGSDVALFSHGHFLRVLATAWLGLPPEAGRFFALDTGAVSILGYERETRVVRVWNRTEG